MQKVRVCSTLVVKVMVALIGLSSVACSSDDVARVSGRGKKKSVETSAVPEVKEENITQSETSTGKVTKVFEAPSSFQVKDVTLLRSSITACMGADKLAVTEDMLIPVGAGNTGTNNADGTFRFLLGSDYEVGEDIIEAESQNLLDFANGNRTGISSDSLTDTYLRSLETVANVVAHSCTSEKTECKCSTEQEAADLLTRCLPAFEPGTDRMQYAALILTESCKKGDSGVRTAIASLIASYSFAFAR